MIKQDNRRRKKYRTKVCKRCDTLFVTHTRMGKICDGCNKKYKKD